MSTEKRVERLRTLMKEKGVEAMLVSKVVNLRYFSGFTGDDSLLLITAERELLLTDFRYMEQAKAETAFEVVEQKAGLWQQAAKAVQELDCRSLGFEGRDVSFDTFQAFRKLLPSWTEENFISLALEPLREVKDAEEIACLRKAVEISDRAFDDVLQFLRPGISERAVAAHLEAFMREHGSERPAFTTIVASGVRGSLPHGTASEKLLVAGEFVTMDYGAVYQGYHSDITRTVVLGEASEKHRELYHTVLEAQILGVKSLYVGISGKEADRIVRDFLTQEGYGENFGHGLGHSVGLEIHEEPRLSPKSRAEHLAEGTVVTVEPGVYLPGWGGLRIEDTVLLEKRGGVPLTKAAKHLIEITQG